MIHETCMRRCLALGRAALAAGETPVGALVLRGDVVLAEGHEETRTLLDPSAHAEVQAVRAACRSLGSVDLSGCTLYTTVSPACYARTCCGALGSPRRLRRPGRAGRRIDLAVRHSHRPRAGRMAGAPEILPGVLAEECLALLRERPPRPL